MSDPKKHHFIPEFFLSAWLARSNRAIADRVLIQYRKPREDKVTTREATPAMVGNGDDLYRLYSESISQQRTLETDHFQKIDSIVAPVFAKLIADHRDRLTDHERYHLARFIIALPARTPWSISNARVMARNIYTRNLADPELTRELNLPGAKTALDVLEQNPHFIADIALVNTIEAQTDPDKIKRLLALDWIIIDTSDAGVDLILGDNVFMLDGDLLNPASESFIAIPFAPNRLLVMNNIGINTRISLRQLVHVVNRESAIRAEEHFFAKDRSHIELARMWLKEFPGRKP